MVAAGVVGEAVGIDYSERVARRVPAGEATPRCGLPLAYHQMNANPLPLPPGPFDLVVNYAAAHHLAMIDRVFRADLHAAPRGRVLPLVRLRRPPSQPVLDGGLGAGVGTQTDELPAHLRQSMGYPNVSIMLHGRPHRSDPLASSSSRHSTVSTSTWRRFVTPRWCHRLSDPHPQLNASLPADDEARETSRHGGRVPARADRARFLAEHPDSGRCSPRSSPRRNKDIIGRHRDALVLFGEQERRSDRRGRLRARVNGGRCTTRHTALQDA